MKKTVKRSTGAAKKAKVTVSIGGKRYRKSLCGSLTDLRKKAENVREKGGTARVIKNKTGSGGCLYVGPNKAKPARKTTAKKTTTRRRTKAA